MRIHRFWSWVAALASAFLTAFAFAQAAPPASDVKPAASTASPAEAEAPANDDVSRAREAFLRGLTQAKGRNFAGAVSEFNASIALFPTRAALSNLALCLTELGRYVDARDTYARILSEYQDSLPAGERADINTQLEALARHIGQISVTSVPEGAAVIIDGQRRGTTPLGKPIAVDAGPHSVRVFHPGYAALEASLTVAAGGLGEVRAVLEAAQRLGTLGVRESSGQVLDVLVNGAVVGKTPYQGALPPGTYSIALAGANGVGTAPSAAAVRADEVASLVLTAGVLDSELRVEPTPSNAQVQIDGVSVGSGVWQGALPSGQHRVDVSADGHRAEQRTVTTRKGERFVLSILLECQATDAAVAPAEAPHRLYVELVGGLAFAPSLGGSADKSCGQTLTDPNGAEVDGCSERALPLGFMAGARVGYQVTPRLGVDVFFGYLRLKESMTRNIYAQYEGQPNNLVYSSDYQDTTTLGGAAFALAPSYRFLEKTPITFRLWFGIGRFNVHGTNGGNFTGDVDNMSVHVDNYVSADEVAVSTWLPFVGPELRIGYVLNRHLSADFGVAALLLMPADIWRYGSYLNDGRRRRVPIELENGDNRTVHLPEELALGVAVTLLPSVAVRWSF